MYEKFGERLKSSLKKAGYSQIKAAEELDLSRNAIGNYIKGRIPEATILHRLSKLCDVSMEWLLSGNDNAHVCMHSEFEELHLCKFRKLNHDNQLRIDGMIDLKLSEQQERQNIYMVAEDDTKVIKEDAPKYVRTVGRVAAGHGVDEIDLMDMDDLVQIAGLKNVDYALKVVGDSMEPLIPDGSTVLVREQPEVENGDIAIVSIDGKVTCKKYYQENGSVWLESINKKYPDRDITEKDGETRVLGKVILDVNGYSR